ncbi:hypothetical protein B0H66DRAFT_596724 [Apodospora peruviana]|uniref:Uncharacterized protein n=1 Tax=Apodospora peruviana TaxID=516989 RepID=A0AAE0IQ23_9PEZI|nr:hypothetical protein B0H66DRAFT_596724 [Apodospora peruviana]
MVSKITPDFPRTFFTIPSTAFIPDDLIQLGQVIKDPNLPFDRIAPPPATLLTGPLAPRTASVLEFVAVNRATKALSVGLAAHAAELVSADFNAVKSHSETVSWDAAALETQYFVPSEAPNQLLGGLQQTAAVRQWLKKMRFRPQARAAYLVTGVKIARQPGTISCRADDVKGIDAQVQAVVDPWGLVQAGVHGGVGSAAGTESKGKPTDSYVFAYQLHEIKVSALTGKAALGDLLGSKNVNAMYGEQNRGADSDEDSDEDSSEGEDDSPQDVANLAVAGGDFGSELPTAGFRRTEVDLGHEAKYILMSAKLM